MTRSLSPAMANLTSLSGESRKYVTRKICLLLTYRPECVRISSIEGGIYHSQSLIHSFLLNGKGYVTLALDNWGCFQS